METEYAQTLQLRRQAETLRKIAGEMKANDPASAANLLEMADGYDERAGQIEPLRPAE